MQLLVGWVVGVVLRQWNIDNERREQIHIVAIVSICKNVHFGNADFSTNFANNIYKDRPRHRFAANGKRFSAFLVRMLSLPPAYNAPLRNAAYFHDSALHRSLIRMCESLLDEHCMESVNQGTIFRGL